MLHSYCMVKIKTHKAHTVLDEGLETRTENQLSNTNEQLDFPHGRVGLDVVQTSLPQQKYTLQKNKRRQCKLDLAFIFKTSIITTTD